MTKEPNDVRPVVGGIQYPSVNELARFICVVNGVQIRDQYDGSENWWMFIGNARTIYEDAKLIERSQDE